MAKCKCKSAARIVSNVVQNMCQTNTCMCGASSCGVLDVCSNPVIGEPKILSLYAPVIYDEIGINLCTNFELGVDLATEYPTVTCASIRITDIAFTYGEGNVEVEPISGRPNCYLVTLSNLTVTFAVNLYDAACRLITTVYPTAVYLPPETTADTYDEDTNPTSVELELFAPYGTSVTGTGVETATVLNVIGFAQGSNILTQGINLYGIPKLIDLDTDDSTVTVGITLVLQSLYFAGYCVNTEGKTNIPKGSLSTMEDNDCLQFVTGELLNLEIKPLEFSCGAEPNCCDDCNSYDNCE